MQYPDHLSGGLGAPVNFQQPSGLLIQRHDVTILGALEYLPHRLEIRGK
jgi:hypothetical protein